MCLLGSLGEPPQGRNPDFCLVSHSLFGDFKVDLFGKKRRVGEDEVPVSSMGCDVFDLPIALKTIMNFECCFSTVGQAKVNESELQAIEGRERQLYRDGRQLIVAMIQVAVSPRNKTMSCAGKFGQHFVSVLSVHKRDGFPRVSCLMALEGSIRHS